jgi:hypothetical protein
MIIWTFICKILVKTGKVCNFMTIISLLRVQINISVDLLDLVFLKNGRTILIWSWFWNVWSIRYLCWILLLLLMMKNVRRYVLIKVCILISIGVWWNIFLFMSVFCRNVFLWARRGKTQRWNRIYIVWHMQQKKVIFKLTD